VRLLVVALLAALVAAGSASGATPTIRTSDDNPLVVRGSGFKAGEKVRVWLVLTRARRYRDVLAGSGGGFTVRFTVTPPQCPLVRSLTATGSKGSRAMRPLRLDCNTPPLA
jgi:hypothetical protein